MNLKLHEAIEYVLINSKLGLKTSEIAIQINRLNLYKITVTSSNISARINKYKIHFFKVNDLVYINRKIKVKSKITEDDTSCYNIDEDLLIKREINIKFENPAYKSFLIYNKFKKLGRISSFFKNGLPKIKPLKSCGIYAIVIPKNYLVQFIDPNIARNNGNVINPWSIDKLKGKWVADSEIVYYGLAGKKSVRSLGERLNDLVKHGKGMITDQGPHSGGEILWQLNNYEKFIVWYLATDNPPEPRKLEKKILQKFLDFNDKLPFANRQR